MQKRKQSKTNLLKIFFFLRSCNILVLKLDITDVNVNGNTSAFNDINIPLPRFIFKRYKTKKSKNLSKVIDLIQKREKIIENQFIFIVELIILK